MSQFRDRYEEFKAAGCEVVGISVDSVFSNKKFAESLNLNFPLAGDFNKEAARAYGVLIDAFGHNGIARRSVFIVDREGNLRYRWISEKGLPDVDEVLREARAIAG